MPAFSTLTDDFTDGVIDAVKWEGSYGTFDETGGRARVLSDTGYPALRSAAIYSLVGSHIMAQVFPAPVGSSTGSVTSEMLINLGAGTRLIIIADTQAGTIQFRSDVQYGDATGVTTAYNPTAHAWWRIREAAGTVHLETSPDALTWTTHRQIPTPSWITTGNNPVFFSTHRDVASTTAQYFQIDNVNLAPTGTTTPGPPSGLLVTPADTSAVLSWTAGTNAASYDVEHRAVNPGGPVVTDTIEPWTEIEFFAAGDGAWSQVSGPPVTLTGTGTNARFRTPASMTETTLVFAYGPSTVTVKVSRAAIGIVQTDGTVRAARFRAVNPNGTTPAPTQILIDGSVAPAPAQSANGLMAVTSATQAQQDEAVRTLWTNFKTNLRQNTTNGWWAVLANAQNGLNPYVAEGQGYGMMLAAQMAPADPAARGIFDGITKYVLDHPSVIDPALHAAQQDINMVNRGGADSATDGDLDIAMGLLMADKQWGSAGTYNYLQLARDRINALKRSVISPKTGLIELGDWSGDFSGSGGTDWTNVSRPSDWMIGHFESFRRATGDPTWDTVKTAHMNALKRLQSVYASSTGLVPDFAIGGPAAVAPAGPNVLESPNDGNYYYNACRVPWRLAMTPDAEARAAAVKIAAWAKTKSGGTPANLPTGYRLDGTTVDEFGTALTVFNYNDMAFTAPMAPAAAAGTDQAWLNALWGHLAANSGNTGYYSGSIQLLCMIRVGKTYDLSLTV